jgi:HlyD family secretion protein
MSKKKKIIIGVIVVIVIALIGVKFLLGGKPKDQPMAESSIEYYTVEDVEQVFINGIVTPTESKEFIKDATLGKLGDLNVKNGDNVEKGAILYQYVDETSDNQITELKFQIESTQAEKEKAARQMQLELNELGSATTTSGEGGAQPNTANTQESIALKYDLNSYDIKQVNQVVAPFNGQVTIPQEQNRDTAILTLTSNDFYVEGEVNERDLSKIKVGQPAEVRTIADNKVYKGEILYISNSPTTAQAGANGASQPGSGSGALSTYTVKLTLKDGQDIRTGFHVQSSIKLDDKKITIPESAIHTDEKDKKKYVFVDDFGTVLRKDIEVAEKADDKGMIIVNSGLEGLDKIIVKSDTELKNGELLDNAGAEMPEEMK